jgi:hypothetical protein
MAKLVGTCRPALKVLIRLYISFLKCKQEAPKSLLEVLELTVLCCAD